VPHVHLELEGFAMFHNSWLIIFLLVSILYEAHFLLLVANILLPMFMVVFETLTRCLRRGNCIANKLLYECVQRHCLLIHKAEKAWVRLNEKMNYVKNSAERSVNKDDA